MHTGIGVLYGNGGDETSASGQDLDINNCTLEDVNEFISQVLPFKATIQFKPALKYSDVCLLYASEFLIQNVQDRSMYLRKPFLIINYCTFIHKFMIKNASANYWFNNFQHFDFQE